MEREVVNMDQNQSQVSLSEMLLFRDNKVAMLEYLRKEYINCVIVTIEMNIPGPIKTGMDISCAYQKGCKSIKKVIADNELNIKKEIQIEDKAGYLMLLVMESNDAKYLKNLMVGIEEQNRIGRLYDIDVYAVDGLSVSRTDIGKKERACFICGRPAKECGRSRNHSIDVLQTEVKEILKLSNQTEGE